MKINFLKLKKINFKFLIKKQKNFYLYSMEDFLKACNKTDSIILEFKHQLDLLNCHFLSPTRADLYKRYLNAFHQKTPFLNFICKRTSRLIFVISIAFHKVYKSCKILILKKK